MSQQPVPHAVSSTRRRLPRWTLTAAGVLTALVGAAFLIWPFIAGSWVIAILFGSALIANGLALLARGGSAPVVGGLLLAAAGVLAIVFDDLTASLIVSFVGVVLIGIGAIWIAVASRLPARRALAILPGALMLVGGIVAIALPAFALSVVAVVGGICLILVGALIIATATRLARGLEASRTTIVM
ncbi:MAG: DUF308 domain-containing protein [Leucobacter sp.]